MKQLEDASGHRTCWLATTDPDGRVHIAGVGGSWGSVITAEYSAPGAGPAPWELYVTAYAVATAEPFGAPRWRFSRDGG